MVLDVDASRCELHLKLVQHTSHVWGLHCRYYILNQILSRESREDLVEACHEYLRSVAADLGEGLSKVTPHMRMPLVEMFSAAITSSKTLFGMYHNFLQQHKCLPTNEALPRVTLF